METNGVNYYKGVLLCSRPNQSPSIPKQKPFCGRVTPHDAIGLVPTKKFDQHKVRKRNLPVLNNHKKWLEHFKKKINDDKQNQQQEKQKQIEKLQKIKQEGLKRRQIFKKSGSIQGEETSYFNEEKASQKVAETSVKKQEKPAQSIVKQAKRNGKKRERPQWSKTEKQKQAQQQQQVDELLDFFSTDDIKDFMQDEEVNRMVKDLKSRIQSMRSQGNKQGGDWKKKQVQKIQQARQENEGSGDEKKDDILSRISKNSQARSMASQKTAQRVQQLEKRKQQKDWDKNTVTDKKSQAASVDEQIAKNVADQVLRNYPNLKHHSNQSIRKLLQKQARQQIKA